MTFYFPNLPVYILDFSHLPVPIARGARRNFFRGGQAMYLLSTGLNKTLLLQPGFAKGLEPKVEMILFKNVAIGRHVEQINPI